MGLRGRTHVGLRHRRKNRPCFSQLELRIIIDNLFYQSENSINSITSAQEHYADIAKVQEWLGHATTRV